MRGGARVLRLSWPAAGFAVTSCRRTANTPTRPSVRTTKMVVVALITGWACGAPAVRKPRNLSGLRNCQPG